MSRPRHQRRNRSRPRGVSRRPSRVGERHTVDCGPIGHGGFVIARVDGAPESPESRGVVLFVRHALPGERVVAEVTEGREGDRFLRADAVQVLTPSPERVDPPCPYAGPGRCGGCDFQHVALPEQRLLKQAVIAEQFQRLARVDVSSLLERVEEVPPALGWRTRMQYVDLPAGRSSGKGLRRHRSHDVIEIDECLIDAGLSGTTSFEVLGREFAVEPDGFWQPHRSAPATLVPAVLEFAGVRPGERALDLYAGVGLFAAFLADAGASVTAVEGDPSAVRHGAANVPEATFVEADVQEWLVSSAAGHDVDLVVLDPTRNGAKRTVIEQIAALAPRAVVYVACDPAALARDTAILAEHGYCLDALRAFDLFPMTHHVECVALFTSTGSDLR